MRSVILLIGFVVIVENVVSGPVALNEKTVGSKTWTFQDHTYYVDDTGSSWGIANETCQRLSYDGLLWLESALEWDYVRAQVLSGHGAGLTYWMDGLYDGVGWRWSNGENYPGPLPSWAAWGSGHPVGSFDNRVCIVYFNQFAASWETHADSRLHRFVCKRSNGQNTTPSPTTTPPPTTTPSPTTTPPPTTTPSPTTTPLPTTTPSPTTTSPPTPCESSPVNLTDFFPYGTPNGDNCMSSHTDTGFLLSTDEKQIQFLAKRYTNVYLHPNGLMSFGGVQPPPALTDCSALSYPSVAVYYVHNQHGTQGSMCSRKSENATLLLKAESELKTAFPDFEGTVEYLLVGTWLTLPPYGGCEQPEYRNSFQLTLAVTNGSVDTYAIMYYNALTWTSWTVSSACSENLQGNQAVARIDGGLGSDTLHELPGSCSTSVKDLVMDTNACRPGKFIYRVSETVESPPNGKG